MSTLKQVRDLRVAISVLVANGQKDVVPSLQESLKKSMKDYINYGSGSTDEAGIRALSAEIKKMKLDLKDSDRKLDFKQVSSLRLDLNLAREALRLKIFMNQVSSCSDY